MAATPKRVNPNSLSQDMEIEDLQEKQRLLSTASSGPATLAVNPAASSLGKRFLDIYCVVMLLHMRYKSHLLNLCASNRLHNERDFFNKAYPQ